MSIVGFQDFWVAGSRFYYRRDPIDGVVQPWIDLGVIQPANPSLEIEKLELEDSDGGVKKVVDERVVKIEETYDITCSNINMDNLALLFLSNPPSAFSQTDTVPKNAVHHLVAGRIAKLHDTDAAETPVYGVKNILGVYKDDAITDRYLVTQANSSNNRFTLDSDPSADGDIAVGKKVIVTDVAGFWSDPNIAGTYTISAKGNAYIEVTEPIPTTDSVAANPLIHGDVVSPPDTEATF
jgi:hypothetical protein